MEEPEHQTEKQTIYWEGYHEGQKESKEEIGRLEKALERIKEITEITEFRDSYQKLILIRDVTQQALKKS